MPKQAIMITITIETDGIIETITGNILGDGNFMKISLLVYLLAH